MTLKLKTQVPHTLDVAALEALIEPFTVQVSRIKNTQHSPIPLPPGEGGEQSGMGWTKGEVLALNSGWLVSSWSGGGQYEISVTDSAQPPQVLKWRPFWNPVEYPERIPPTLVDGSRPGLVTVQSTTQPSSTPQQNVQVPMAFPNGLPQVPQTFTPAPAPQPMYAQPMSYTQPYYQPPPQPYMGQHAFQAQQAEAERRRMEERLAAAEAQLANARAETLQRQYQIDLERQRAEHAATIQRLEARIAELATAHTKAPNAEFEALREQNRMLQQQAEAERREREMERRERETRDQITMLKQGLDSQLAAMQQRHQELMVASQSNKTDPLIQFMIQQNQNSIAAMERISTQSSLMIKELQPFMMGPRDMMAVARDASSGTDAITNKLAASYQSVIEMQGKVIENAMQLNQGGSPAIDLIREGVNGVKDLAAKYVTSTNRAKQVEAQSQAQVAQAQAQAQAVTAQAQAAITQAQLRAQQPQPQIVQAPRPTNGLSGPNNGAQNANSYEEWQKRRGGNDVPPEQARETVSQQPKPVPTVMPNAASAAHAKRLGKTDFEWFGPALGEVQGTRAAVAAFFAKMRKVHNSADEPPPIEETDATAENVAKGMVQAAGFVASTQMPVPAITELLFQGRYDDFVVVLLPDATDAYRDDVVLEFRKLNGEVVDEPDDEDEGEGQGEEHEDGSPSDDVADGSAAKPVKPTVRMIRPAGASA